MTRAPATTVATAVRQHGGGRHPLNLPCTEPAGRLQDSRGGVINRRAEGATSSNTLPASCAAAAHPTTGVRRARELSPSLRSQNRPPAQLVEGYRHQSLEIDWAHCPLSGRQISLKLSQMTPAVIADLAVVAPELEDFLPSRVLITRPMLQIAEQAREVLSEFVHKRHTIRMWIVVKRAIQAGKYSLEDGRGNLSVIVSNEFKLIKETCDLAAYLVGCIEQAPGVAPLPCKLLFMAPLRILPGQPDRDTKAHQRTKGLHPARSDFASVYSQHQDVSCKEDQDNPRHRDRQVLLCPLPAALVPHPYHLDAQEHRPSLPALCHHVQRGAA